MTDVLIIGAGPAGMNAAIYASRAGLEVAMLEAGAPGGKMMLTAEVDNWIGTPNVTGPELAFSMYEHSLMFGAKHLYGNVVNIEKKDDVFFVTCDDGNVYESLTVIVATGTIERKLGIPGEDTFYGKGVSYCAVCDGAFFKDQPITVIGGGNSALEEAVYLTKFGSVVNVVIRRDVFRADRIIQERLLANPKINVIRKHVPLEIIGDKKVQGIVLEHVDTKEKTTIETSAVFPFVGLDPATSFLASLGVLNEEGYVVVNTQKETKIQGLYAAGDVCADAFRQIATAVGDGATAGQNAAHYVDIIKG